MVQTKFYSSAATTQYVHREYVVAPDGTPRGEFFLVAHSGVGDDARAYLLGAGEITRNFIVTEEGHSYSGRFRLPGSEILSSGYQIMNREFALDRLERALKDADFRENRSFLSWAIPSRSNDVPPIVEMFVEPIDNWWGDIPDAFEKMRRNALSARYDLEEAIKKLQRIEECDDPRVAFELARDLQDDWEVSPPDLLDDDFECAVKSHEVRHKQLEDAGLLPAHRFLRRYLAGYLSHDLAPRMPVDSATAYVVCLQYDATSLENPRCMSRLATAPELFPHYDGAGSFHYHKDAPSTCGLLPGFDKGRLEIYLFAGRYAYATRGRDKSAPDKRSWSEKLRNVIDEVVSLTMQQLLTIHLGEL